MESYAGGALIGGPLELKGSFPAVYDNVAFSLMTKAEIKEWADVYKFNVPLSLRKAEMIKRFVEEADEYVGSEHESPTSITFYILCIIGGLLLGTFVLAPLLEYFFY